jgi:hypothetical protein
MTHGKDVIVIVGGAVGGGMGAAVAASISRHHDLIERVGGTEIPLGARGLGAGTLVSSCQTCGFQGAKGQGLGATFAPAPEPVDWSMAGTTPVGRSPLAARSLIWQSTSSSSVTGGPQSMHSRPGYPTG